MAASQNWEVYADLPAFVLGFHGCDKKVGEAILRGKQAHLAPSENDYDWLGHGIYFWESSPQRALEFAKENAAGAKTSKGKITMPFVIGAVIDLKRCLNLIDRTALSELPIAYHTLEASLSAAGLSLPSNGKEKRARKLDCAVFQMLHQMRKETGDPAYCTVRGTFSEGGEVYPGSGFGAKDHTQICVRDVSCIKGYFRPITR